MRSNEQRDWKLPAFGKHCPSPIDWARMAAFIDGEGTILINPRRGRMTEYDSLPSTFYLKLGISNTDYGLMAWLKMTFGGSFNYKNSQKYMAGRNVKDSWDWTSSANRAAWVLHNCMPYFIIKGEQAEIGIRLQETMKLFKRGSRKSLPSELVEERRELKRNLLIMKARGREISSEQAKRIEEVS